MRSAPLKAAPAADPLREALRAAIAKYDAAVQEISANEARFREISAKTTAAFSAHEAAEAAVAETEHAHAAHAIGDGPEPSLTPRLVREAAAEAADRLAALRAARAACQVKREQLTTAKEIAAMRRDDALAAVLREEAAPALAAEYQRRLRELFDLRRALECFESAKAIPAQWRFWRSEEAWPAGPAETAWREALAALAVDADAELPRL